MHEKYTTRGIVIYSSAYREADKIISIYTEDFGLVSAVAAGVRRSTSKLRYHTQDYSVRNFSLVRGRDLWRLVGAEEISDNAILDQTAKTIDRCLKNPKTNDGQESAQKKLSGENLAVYSRVLSLIRRLVRGEEKNERIFLTLFSLHDLLLCAVPAEAAHDKENPPVEGKGAILDISALETLAVFRILHDLGYVKSETKTEPLIRTDMIGPDQVANARSIVPSLISAINKGLTESHL
jgi:hypothetical protein